MYPGLNVPKSPTLSDAPAVERAAGRRIPIDTGGWHTPCLGPRKGVGNAASLEGMTKGAGAVSGIVSGGS